MEPIRFRGAEGQDPGLRGRALLLKPEGSEVSVSSLLEEQLFDAARLHRPSGPMARRR
jgi:hypothetical protein